MSATYLSRPTKYTLYRRCDNPIFGESVTSVELDDEAGGVFLKITQLAHAHGPGGTLRFDFDEIPVLMQAIEALKVQAMEIDRENVLGL